MKFHIENDSGRKKVERTGLKLKNFRSAVISELQEIVIKKL